MRSAFIARFKRLLPLTILADIRHHLLLMVVGRRCMFAATANCNVACMNDIVESANQPLYILEACPTIVPRNHQNFAIKQSLEYTAVVRQ